MTGKFTTLEKAILTKDWTLEERTALAHFLKAREYREGETLFLSKSKDRGLFIIGAGLIQIQYDSVAVNLKEGDSFGELSLIFASQKLVSATAIKASQVWLLPLDQWHDLRKVAPVISIKLLESICQKFAGILNSAVPPPRSASLSVTGATRL